MPSSSSATPKVAGTIRSKNPLKGAVEILPERLYYAALKSPPPSHNILASTPRPKHHHKSKDGVSDNDNAQPLPQVKKQIHFFCVDKELVYWNFFLDFGPLNLGQLARFCQKLNDKLRKFPVVCFYSSATSQAKRANAIFLICAWQLLYLDRSPEQAYHGFDATSSTTRSNSSKNNNNNNNSNCSQPPVSQSQGALTTAALPPFHDASPCQCTYDLSIMDCLQGLQKARQHGFYNHETFDVEEYEHYEQVENGDLNWIVQDKILAFAGPSYERTVSPEGYCTLAPSDYIPYFTKKNIGLVVRLNQKNYHEQDFINAGIQHVDAFFIDGSCPPMKVLQKVLTAFENCKNGFAVHCKAGLGRTGTCIGAYLMKHYRFTASEVIAWMRICRPGCVIGPQQHFLKQIEARMWQEGEAAGLIERPIGNSSSSIKQEKGRQEVLQDMTMEDELMVETAEAINGQVVAVLPSDAVQGRTGQAEGLLAARGRREKGHHKPPPSSLADSTAVTSTPTTVDSSTTTSESSSTSTTSTTTGAAAATTTPMTPEQSKTEPASVAVTPDSSQKPDLWC